MSVTAVRHPRSATLLGLLLFGLGSGSARAQLPADGWLVWASKREDGRHEIYRLGAAAGAEAERVTFEGGKFPIWSPDGRWIAYRHGSDTTHVVRWDGSDDREICAGIPVFWMHDNSGVVCGDGGGGFEDGSRVDSYFVADPETGQVTPLFRRTDFAHLRDDHPPAGEKHLIPGGISADGRWLVGWVFDLYRRGYVGDNGSHQGEHASVVLDLSDPARIYFLGAGCTTTTAPAGSRVYHVSRESPTAPDIFGLDLEDLATRGSYRRELGFADDDWGHEYFPRISTDNRFLTYGASVACHWWYACDYEIFVHRLGAGETERTRLTEHPANDNYPHLYVGPLWRPETRPRLLLTPSWLNLWPDSATAVISRLIAVKNSGAGTLETPALAVGYQGEAGGWLEATVVGQGPERQIEAVARTTGLAAGTHRATIEVEVPGAVDGRQQIGVSLNVVEAEPRGDGGSTAAADAGATAPDAGASFLAPGGGGGCASTGRASGRPPSVALLLLAWLLCPARRRRQ